MNDLIDRQAAIDEIEPWLNVKGYSEGEMNMLKAVLYELRMMPSAQPTLYGYSIEHLALIARVMQKENVTPEKAIECFEDFGRMLKMIMEEQKEMIKRAVEKWTV